MISGVAHNFINLIGQGKDLVIISAHTIGHQRFIDANHVAMAHLQFLCQEGQQWDAESNFARLGRSDIKSHRWASLNEISAEFIGKDGQWTLSIMFEEAYRDIGVAR